MPSTLLEKFQLTKTAAAKVRLIKTCIKEGYTFKEDEKEALLYYGISKGHVKFVDLLIKEFKCDINQSFKSGTFLTLAAAKGHLALVKHFTQLSADTQLPDKKGFLPLHQAACYGHDDIISYFVEDLDMNVDMRSADQMTAFIIATDSDNLSTMQLLISLGANPHLYDRDGYSAINYAVSEEAIKYLVKRLKLDINKPTANKERLLPLDGIIDKKDNIDLFKLHIKYGAKSSDPDKEGNYLTHLAAKVGAMNILTYLIKELGVCVNTVGKFKRTALMIACEFNQLDTVKQLVKLGADIHLVDDTNNTILDLASAFSSRAIIRYIIEELGMDVNSVLLTGDKPLGAAIANNNYDAALELIRLKANLQQPGLHGNYPIHDAVKFGNTDMVTYLMSKDDALVLQPSLGMGKTALDIAAEKGNLPIFKKLVQFYHSRKISLDPLCQKIPIHPDNYNIILYLASMNNAFQMSLLNKAIDSGRLHLALAIFHRDKLEHLYLKFKQKKGYGFEIIRSILTQIPPKEHPSLLKILCVNFLRRHHYDTLLTLGAIEYSILNKTKNLNYELKAIKNCVSLMSPLAHLQKSKSDPLYERLPPDLFNYTLSFITASLMKTPPAVIKTVMQKSPARKEKDIYRQRIQFFKTLDNHLPAKNPSEVSKLKRKA